MTTASGVSSIIMSTPVSVSSVLMLRPSLPIIRPFISSLGRLTELTVTSLLTSVASLWIEVTMISRATLSALICASCSILLMISGRHAWLRSASVDDRLLSHPSNPCDFFQFREEAASSSAIFDSSGRASHHVSQMPFVGIQFSLYPFQVLFYWRRVSRNAAPHFFVLCLSLLLLLFFQQLIPSFKQKLLAFRFRFLYSI